MRAPAALRQRNFALLWSGQAISLIGDGIFTVAVALEALQLDHRPTGLSFVLAGRLLPTVGLLLFGGVLVDRVPRRLAMLGSDAARALTVGAMALLAGLGQLSLLELVLLAVAFGVADSIFYPASTAIVPELLPAELLVQGSALNQGSQTLAGSLLGPALGGVLATSLGAAWGFGADAVSFVVSATCLALMASSARVLPAPSRRRILTEVHQGISYCLSHPWLWATLLGAAVANFALFSPLGVLVPLLVRNVLHQGGVALGLVLASAGLGGGMVSLLVGRFGAPRRRITWMCVAWGGAGATAIIAALAPNVWVLGGAAFVVGGLLLYGNALWSPLIQTLVPPELLGRVSSVDWLVSLSLSPLGVLVAGAVAAAIGTRLTLLGGAVISTCTAAVVLIPGVRAPEREPLQPATTSLESEPVR